MTKLEKQLFFNDFIEATKDMPSAEYLEFMDLSGPDRIKRVHEILEAGRKGLNVKGGG